jgi:hypothetical protein
MVLIAGMLPLLAGCGGGVRSRFNVETIPAGADVTVNDVHLGRAPLQMPFIWYWYYDFEAELEGYETKRERVRFRSPVYLWVPLDLFAEMLPFKIYDTKTVVLELEKEDTTPDPEFVLR